MRHVLTLLATMLALTGPAAAQDDPARLEMLPGWRLSDGRHVAAFRILLQDGWKTYWRTPGDTGIPPSVDWSGSRNIGAVALRWPAPEVFDTGGLRTIGYAQELILPFEATPRRDGRDMVASGVLDIGVCSDICVPMSIEFSIDLASQGAGDGRIRAALAAQPRAIGADEAGLRCRLDPITDGLRVSAMLDLPGHRGLTAAIFEHADPGIWVSSAEVSAASGRTLVQADMVPPAATPFALDRHDLRLTLLTRDGAFEIAGCPAG